MMILELLKFDCCPAADDRGRRLRVGWLGQHQLPLPGGQQGHRDLLRGLPARPHHRERSAAGGCTLIQVTVVTRCGAILSIS